MNLWIVTTGSSDVQLIDNEDLDWDGWRHSIKKFIYRLPFKPTRAIDEDGEPYRLPARVLSIAYNQSPVQVKPYLTFPLLKNFSDKLKEKNINIDQIIVLVSNQEDIFPVEVREDKRCPYWQDTDQLYPILQSYLHKQFPHLDPDKDIKPLVLKPEPSGKGLDDWDSVLDLVRKSLKSLTFETEPQTVFVSHQAGTPAISSAVQFCSLAKFGDRVKFLVSNEQDATLTDTVESSAYLKGIKREQSKKLLENHDYAGVNNLIGEYLQGDAKMLLNAALQWNIAKFSDFLNKLRQYPKFVLEVEERMREENWWWTAYEAAYLAWIRLKQGNTVEALFHSFRAAEGLISNWAKWYYSDDIKETKSGAPIAKYRLNSHLPTYLTEKLSEIKNQELLLHSEELFKLLKETRPEITNNEDVKVIWNGAKNIRNQQFHRLLGLDKREVFRAWGTKENDSAWKIRLKTCLNTITDQTFESLEEASLMAQVHDKLKNAIANL
ncbi:hypothetical protein C7B61_01230 [filamentous cyanobacterium CCP1]|nr:hypothetical protein C7B76_01985 [filamentous cyanobacterium CCP2]PSB68372.1 hypothetical protein C7B61_01230 [filamentous cyanobacterium CCP1]